jgi:hypothetical protein
MDQSACQLPCIQCVIGIASACPLIPKKMQNARHDYMLTKIVSNARSASKFDDGEDTREEFDTL